MTITTTATEANLDKIISKILKLTTLAERDDTPPAEADNARARAEKMITDYNVQAQWLADARPLERVIPVLKTIPIYPHRSAELGDATAALSELFTVLARHCGVRIYNIIKVEDVETEDGKTEKYRVMQVVGFESDIRYLEVLFASLRLHVASKIAPVWLDRESLAENVTRLHEAGIDYGRIASMAVAKGFTEYDRGELVQEWVEGRWVDSGTWRRDGHWKEGYYKKWYANDKAVKGKLMRVYDRYCKETGREKVLVTAPANYRMWFMHGFTGIIRQRVNTMSEIRNQSLVDMDKEHGRSEGSAALALRDRGDVVDEAFYNFFPDMRPSTEPATAAQFKTKGRARGRGSRGGGFRQVAYNTSAVSAGRTVGATVDLSGGRNNLKGTRKEIG
jgi:hypothetical protein